VTAKPKAKRPSRHFRIAERNKPSRFVQKLIDEETRAGIAIAKRDGFFDLIAQRRRHPEQREQLRRTHRFITGKKA
jgi:hypothetical protein